MLTGPKVETLSDLRKNRDEFLAKAKEDPRWGDQPDPFGFEQWQDAPGELAAYVNHGRWVADCPNCNGGIALIPRVQEGACYDCGWIFHTIHFPTPQAVAAAEKALVVRPAENRNWNPIVEKPAQLALENKEHDLG